LSYERNQQQQPYPSLSEKPKHLAHFFTLWHDFLGRDAKTSTVLGLPYVPDKFHVKHWVITDARTRLAEFRIYLPLPDVHILDVGGVAFLFSLHSTQ